MLFYCVFAREAGFVVDQEDEAHARAAAREEVGEEPLRIVPMPNVFGARVHFVDDEDDPELELVELEPMQHVLDVFAAIEDESMCPSEAEDDKGAVLNCGRPANHEGKHKAGAFEWQ